MTIGSVKRRLILVPVAHSALDEAAIITLHVIYDHPRDYPGYVVVRKWTADLLTEAAPVPDCRATLAGSLEEARRTLPAGAVALGRMRSDDPVIAEVWMEAA